MPFTQIEIAIIIISFLLFYLFVLLLLCDDYCMLSFLMLQTQMPDPKTYKQHFENKHPKNDLPAELKDA